VCFNQQRGVCSRTINAREVTELVQDAVLSVFSRIALTPDKRRSDRADSGEREKLAVALETDQAALQHLDDDRYDGIIDKATWVRQRNRLVERIQARQRDYQNQLARTPVIDVDVNMATVATEWPDRSVAWQHEAARLILEAVLIHAHPEGVPSIVNRRRGETSETYQARLREHRQRLLARRVEFIWRA
jgi:site-specific DNA recombinase